MTPVILFPQRPFSPREVDSEFTLEFNAAKMVGFGTGFYDHDAIGIDNVNQVLSRLTDAEPGTPLILRGWMLTGEAYSTLFAGLSKKGYQPQTSPKAYEQAHYLPFAYPLTEGHAPRSAWVECDDVDDAWQLYQQFQSGEAIIKDWVKSAKTRWKDGCYIPAQTNEERFQQIFKVFRAERGKLFNRGVVIREFMPIVERGSDIRGLPLVEEIRFFFWKGQILVRPDQSHPSPLDELPRWEIIAKRFDSPFITIDVALLTSGEWKIVEVGDGGVSGLPMGLDPERFYASLWNHVSFG